MAKDKIENVSEEYAFGIVTGLIKPIIWDKQTKRGKHTLRISKKFK